MIENFEVVKQQLGELSDVINKFKSEAVQLKIIELVFKGAGFPPDEENGVKEDTSAVRRRMKRRKAPKATSAAQPGDGRKRPTPKAKGTGAGAALDQFIQDGFFNQKRTIGAVVDHCETKARNFKANELSGPLARLVRNDRLSRTKNADNQYEYIKK